MIYESNFLCETPKHNFKLKGITKPTLKELILAVILDLILPAFCFGVIFSVIWTSMMVALGVIK